MVRWQGIGWNLRSNFNPKVLIRQVKDYHPEDLLNKEVYHEGSI
jgi:hypothetical protein